MGREGGGNRGNIFFLVKGDDFGDVVGMMLVELQEKAI